VLRAHGLTKVYRTSEVEVQALPGVDLALAPRELIASCSGADRTGARG
jgi:hypothetical protein